MGQFTTAHWAASVISDDVKAITTAGYLTLGDGGVGLYVRTAGKPNHAACFRSQDRYMPDGTTNPTNGGWWEYIPGIEGLNSRVFGVRADGVTDDAVAIQSSIDYFASANRRSLARSGTILYSGVSKIGSPIIIPGGPGHAIKIQGQYGIGRGNAVGTAFHWLGDAKRSMFISYGANQSCIEGIQFGGAAGSGVVNCFHVAADNTVNTTLISGVSAGTGVVATPVSMANITVGMALGVGTGATFEVVYVTSTVPGSSFSADFANSHPSGAQVGGSAGSSGVRFRDCCFSVSGHTNSTGIWFGNLTASGTMQVSEAVVEDCIFIGNGSPGNAYTGIRFTTGGNVKNFAILRSNINGFQRGISIEVGSGAILLEQPIFGNSTVVDIWASAGHSLSIRGGESEPIAGARFLEGTIGGFYNGIVIEGFSWQGAPGPDDYIINHGGDLTIIGCDFRNFRTGSSWPKIKCADISGLGNVSPSSIISLGSHYQRAADNTEIFFDGSNNPLMAGGDFSALRAKSRFVSIGDYGANPLPARMGNLALLSSGLSTLGMTAGLTYGAQGGVGHTYQKSMIPYGAFQSPSTTKDINVFKIPPRSKIVGIYADVTEAFEGTASTLNLRFATNLGGDDLLLDFDAKTTGVRGLLDAELGASINRSNAVQGGFMPSWTDFVTLRARLTSGSGNLSALAKGSVTLYVAVERLN